MHYVYILLLSNGRLYTGCTNDLKRRYQEHQQGLVKSTRNKVKKLIHYEAYALTSDAVRREKYLKTTAGKKILRKQIKNILIEEGIIDK